MDIIPEVIEKLNEDYNIRKDGVERNNSSLTKFFESCESVMEQKFLSELLDVFPGFPIEHNGNHIHSADSFSPHFLGFNLDIFPQREIKIEGYDPATKKDHKNYRADFLLKLVRWDHDAGVWDTIIEVVLEVDGHDYHERTKEQAKRDRSRDRKMTSSGYYVFRFTGSELYNQMEDSVMEVYTFLVKKVVAYSSKKGLKFY